MHHFVPFSPFFPWGVYYTLRPSLGWFRWKMYILVGGWWPLQKASLQPKCSSLYYLKIVATLVSRLFSSYCCAQNLCGHFPTSHFCLRTIYNFFQVWVSVLHLARQDPSSFNKRKIKYYYCIRGEIYIKKSNNDI